MPAAELTQKVGYCMITSMSTVCYIEKNNLPGTAGNGKKTALREAIITNINTRTISVNISMVHEPKRFILLDLFQSCQQPRVNVRKSNQQKNRFSNRFVAFSGHQKFLYDVTLFSRLE